MATFLSDDGLLYVWQKLKTLFVSKEAGKGLSSNDFTDAEKEKLSGIAAGANKYTHPAYTSRPSGLYKVTVDASGHVSAAAAAAKSDITALGIPAQDTTYSAATGSAAGLMSALDKTKLDAVPAPSTLATQSYVAQQVAAAGHITKSIVSSLPSASSAAENVIYMVPKTSGSGSQSYDEYMKINGALEKIGDTQTTIEAISNAEIDEILAT